MSSIADQLVDMGFERVHAERAAACNANLEQAIDWLVTHSDELMSTESAPVAAPTVQPAHVEQSAEPQRVAAGEEKGGEKKTEQAAGSAASAESTGDVATATALHLEAPTPDVEMQEEARSAAVGVSGTGQLEQKAGEANAEHSEKANQASQVADPLVNSFKCDDCGKLLKDDMAVQWHASKTGHANYSESEEALKPLTAEEKKQKAEELRQKIKTVMAEKDEKSRKEAIEKERIRREEGKKVIEMKEEMARKEMLAIAEARKREKMETEAAKKRVLEEIARDRAERAERAAGGAAKPTERPAAPAPVQQQASAPKNYDETTIQFRLLNGSIVKQKFGAKETLAAVRTWLIANHLPDQEFSMLVPFPNKVFKSEDYMAPLHSLGLVPNASLVVTLQQQSPELL
ncbi:hypothetical protein WR25_03452 [Diploscapter pachys]|uniref:UBX domain-containing protein n=1 Tax=Diploscapter pachys TaxID=2018661 RepID=A0A2A2J772_9BILA|nr:hypothetical protein WR25_03452 [Diploscapter pachys]